VFSHRGFFRFSGNKVMRRRRTFGNVTNDKSGRSGYADDMVILRPGAENTEAVLQSLQESRAQAGREIRQAPMLPIFV